MIKNIVFDLGGVLIDFDPKKTVEMYFDEEYREFILQKVFFSDSWREIDAGRLAASDFADSVVSLFPEKIRPCLNRMILNFYPYMKPFSFMETFVKRLKDAGYNLYLLSNTPETFYEAYKNYPAVCMLDGYFISARYKCIKPQPEIYNLFLEKFSLNADECFFIDDSSANIEGALNCGIKGFLFDTKDVNGLERELNNAGVIF